MRALLIAVLLIGCSKKKAAEDPGPTCDKVVDQMLIVMNAGMAGHGGLQMGDRKTMVAQCEARKMSADERRCLVAAKDLTALANCRPAGKAPDMPKVNVPPPLPTAPVPTPAPEVPSPANDPVPTGSAAGSAAAPAAPAATTPPPPPPAPASAPTRSGTRGGGTKKSSDPEEGGE